jgi:hypothetical protein
MAHDEFPPLTQAAELVLRDAEHDLILGAPNWRRCYLAAGLREAMKQASPDKRGSCKWDRLGAIADNLHSPPQAPPTKEEMEAALCSLLGQITYHPKSQLAQEAEILLAGIAHYCKEQP